MERRTIRGGRILDWGISLARTGCHDDRKKAAFTRWNQANAALLVGHGMRYLVYGIEFTREGKNKQSGKIGF
jgi:hypothetical protein